MISPFRNGSDGCRLLRVSRQVNSEATTILYRENTFNFNDIEHRVLWMIQTNVDWSGAAHECDVGHLYMFLRLIGRSNRQKLGSISLSLNHLGFCYSTGEAIPEESQAPLGDVLAKSFELLSEVHNLRTIEIKCGTSDGLHYSYGHLFRMRDTFVIRNLRKIKGIQQLICYEDGEYPEACEIIRELKADMETPTRNSKDEKSHESSRQATISVRLAILEEERKELTTAIQAIGQKMESTDRELEAIGLSYKVSPRDSDHCT